MEIKFAQTCVDLETDIRIGIPSTLHIELKVEWNFYDQYYQSGTKPNLVANFGHQIW